HRSGTAEDIERTTAHPRHLSQDTRGGSLRPKLRPSRSGVSEGRRSLARYLSLRRGHLTLKHRQRAFPARGGRPRRRIQHAPAPRGPAADAALGPPTTDKPPAAGAARIAVPPATPRPPAARHPAPPQRPRPSQAPPL